MNYSDKLLKLKDYAGEDEVVTSFDIKHELSTQEKPIKCYTGFAELDMADSMDGMEAGELIVLSGPRKNGKTLFGQTITENLYKDDVQCLWFSFELTPRQFIDRFPNLPVFMMPKKMKAYALDWLKERILEGIVKFGISVVFIDHLHFLFDMARVRNVSLEIGQVIRQLKTLAIELNLVIFLMCHTNKIQAIQNDMSDDALRDSSFVSQESDACLMIWRLKDTMNRACVKLCYSRRTGAWEKSFQLYKINGLLREYHE